MKSKKLIAYVLGTVFATVLLTAIFTVLFFPYKKAFTVAFENYMLSTNMQVSMQNAHTGISTFNVDKVSIGHKDVQNTPLFVLENFSATVDFLSILKGTLNADMQADVYGGKLTARLSDIPFINQKKTTLDVSLHNIDLSKYPEGALSFLKKISGTLNAKVKRNLSLYDLHSQKGTFIFELTDGEITELKVSGLPRLILPYKKLSLSGKIEGTRYYVDNISFNISGVKVAGAGYADLNDIEPYLNFNFTYEAISKQAPLKGKGKILITGTPLSPSINWTAI